MDKETLRHYIKLEDAVKSRIGFLKGLMLTDEEVKIRKNELSIILEKISVLKEHRLKPLKEIKTIKGIDLKLGDSFHIAGDEVSIYKIVAFPDSVTIRGESSNPAIGKPWTCEVYSGDVVKVKTQKEKKVKRVKKEKKRKKIRIEAGEYFSTYSNSTIYKAITTTNKRVKGINKLTAKNAPKQIDASLRDIIIKTKKDYKKQHKAERK